MIIKETEQILFNNQGDNTEVYLILESDGFNVIWGDYVANVWEEKYDSLGAALARVAVLVHASEHTSDFGFIQSSKEEFTQAWDVAMKNFVFALDVD
jgi:hypothetical protein